MVRLCQRTGVRCDVVTDELRGGEILLSVANRRLRRDMSSKEGQAEGKKGETGQRLHSVSLVAFGAVSEVRLDGMG